MLPMEACLHGWSMNSPQCLLKATQKAFCLLHTQWATHVTTKAFSDATEMAVGSTNSPPTFSTSVPEVCFV